MPGFKICGGGEGPDAKGKDPLRTYRWKLDSIEGGASLGDYLDIAAELDIPSKEFEILNVEGASMDYKVPKKVKFNDISVGFYDYKGLQPKIEEWMDKIWSYETGLFEGQAPTDIKGTIKFSLLDASGNPEQQFELVGAFPRKISHTKLSMRDENIKLITVEFCYDYYKLT